MTNLVPGELLTHNRCNASTGCGPKGCGQSIAFRLTRSGAKMPLNPVPSHDGNIALIGETDDHEGIAEVLEGDRGDGYEGHLYITHFATCKDGAQFRRSRPATRSAPYPQPKTLDNAAQKLAEDQIKANAAWFARECKEKGLKTVSEVGALFAERQKKWWRDERNRKARQEWILRVRSLVREELGLQVTEAA